MMLKKRVAFSTVKHLEMKQWKKYLDACYKDDEAVRMTLLTLHDNLCDYSLNQKKKKYSTRSTLTT